MYDGKQLSSIESSEEFSTEAKRTIRVMIVDDHPLIIQGLRQVIEMDNSLQVVAEVDNGLDAIYIAKTLSPDVILMDINLPELNGLQATHEIKTDINGEYMNIIILTAYHDEEQFFHALRAGASAYYPKDIQPGKLLSAILTVAGNRCVIHDEEMSKARAFQWIVHQLEPYIILGNEISDRFIPLQPREMDILALLVRGASNKEIAITLKISRQTVKNHMTSVLRKLGVEDRTQAAVLALRRGWFRLEDSLL